MRELHFIEDTTGSRVGLHFLRDKEKREVDFLVVIDGKPVMMIEVKEGDDSFSAPLFRFHGYLKSALPMQIVYNLKHRKSNGPAKMIPVVDFLLEVYKDRQFICNGVSC